MASHAAQGLHQWIIKMKEYDEEYRDILPKKEKLEIADATLKEKDEASRKMKMALQEIEEKMRAQREELD
jgi:dynein heavy chain